MSPISLSGLASGMDTDAVISQLMALERVPRQRTELQQAAVRARQENLRDISSKLGALQTAAAGLRSAALWEGTQTVESSDATKVAAQRTGGAGPGGYQVEVTRLASATQRTFTYTSQPSASQLSIAGETIDLAENATLDDAVSAINAASTKVYAVNVNGSLVLSSRTTGAASDFAATGAAVAENGAAAKAGQDAAFRVDGVDRASASNTVTDAIPGLELTLKAPTSSPMTITVGAPGVDQEAVKAKVRAFVEQYNKTMETLRTAVAEKRVANPSNTTDARKGSLYADDTVVRALRQLRETVGQAIGGMTTYDDLADIGISTGAATGSGTLSKDAVAGKLVLDEAKLSAALTADPAAVQKLLGGKTGTDGAAQALEAVIRPFTETGGALDGRITSADSEISRLSDRLATFDDRLAAKEERLRRQFVALEQALARSQSLQADLAARLGSLPTSRR